ncbi:MAG: SGNH/GDSL hydrolase family protein, partial [Planktomarina sp.]|nr:SGNH/GDSL hydrolase family protein [Planktomarina sp.]
MPTLLTFGDSNTHGTRPILAEGDYGRFDAKARWPCVAKEALGDKWILIEEGLPGRTTCFEDPIMGSFMNGWTGLKIALSTHGPIDLLTIMLGTNDCKALFGNSARDILGGISGLLAIAQNAELQSRHGGYKTVLIAPPPIVVTGIFSTSFYGADRLSEQLSDLYSEIATLWGIEFFDAGDVIATSPVDGVHFEKEAHQTLGTALAKKIRTIM